MSSCSMDVAVFQILYHWWYINRTQLCVGITSGKREATATGSVVALTHLTRDNETNSPVLLMPLAVSRTSVRTQTVAVMSWNIQVGRDRGFLRNGWPKRKVALKTVLCKESADIICFQEVLLAQLEFLRQVLPNHEHIGVGRDDGRERGEFCPIFFNREMFELVQSNTFWLSNTPERCIGTWDIVFKRICTWSHLRSRDYGVEFFVFNTHFPLNSNAHAKSATLIVKFMEQICPSKQLFLAGDFNCSPGSEAWTLFRQFGLENAEAKLKNSDDLSPTYHLFGKPVACIDGLFVSSEITVNSHTMLNNSIAGTYPSDHFGTLISASI